MGRSQDDCWNYTIEIEAILKDTPDAGRRAITAKLKGTYSITTTADTLGRWLKTYRDALLAGTLERPMLDDDGRPEDYAEQIASILKAEPRAGFDRLHTELRRLYRVVVSHQRLRTFLALLTDLLLSVMWLCLSTLLLDGDRRKTQWSKATSGYRSTRIESMSY